MMIEKRYLHNSPTIRQALFAISLMVPFFTNPPEAGAENLPQPSSTEQLKLFSKIKKDFQKKVEAEIKASIADPLTQFQTLRQALSTEVLSSGEKILFFRQVYSELHPFLINLFSGEAILDDQKLENFIFHTHDKAFFDMMLEIFNKLKTTRNYKVIGIVQQAWYAYMITNFVYSDIPEFRDKLMQHPEFTTTVLDLFEKEREKVSNLPIYQKKTLAIVGNEYFKLPSGETIQGFFSENVEKELKQVTSLEVLRHTEGSAKNHKEKVIKKLSNLGKEYTLHLDGHSVTQDGKYYFLLSSTQVYKQASSEEKKDTLLGTVELVDALVQNDNSDSTLNFSACNGQYISWFLYHWLTRHPGKIFPTIIYEAQPGTQAKINTQNFYRSKYFENFLARQKDGGMPTFKNFFQALEKLSIDPTMSSSKPSVVIPYRSGPKEKPTFRPMQLGAIDNLNNLT
jgi:hypothetical protein